MGFGALLGAALVFVAILVVSVRAPWGAVAAVGVVMLLVGLAIGFSLEKRERTTETSR